MNFGLGKKILPRFDTSSVRPFANAMVPYARTANRIAGVELGAVPIAAALSMASEKPYVMVRKASKEHGTKHEFELKALPRVKGRGTNVIITEYDLPRPTIEPHDVVIVNGEAWYTNFGEQFLGKIDPKTGKHTEYAMPELRKGFPTGNLDLGVDRDGNLLLGMMYQGGVAKFDPKAEKF